MGMEEFYTREASNDGIKIPLILPSGEKSDHWIMVHGVDSDAFRRADTEAKRDALRLATLPEGDKCEAIQEAKRRLISALIFSWSFEEPCTAENVRRFLKEAPQVSDAIDRITGDRMLFFALRSASSKRMQKPNVVSKKSRKARNTPSSNT